MKIEGKFISILSDYGFKVTFADESETLFLRRALQAIIQSPHRILEVEFLRNQFEGLTIEARGGLYDLFCKDEKGNNFIVEMQLGPYKHFIRRAKFYAFQRFNTLVKKGKYKFDDLPKIYCIGFLAENIFPQSEHYYHFGTLKNQHGEEMDDQITHIIIEVGKFDKPLERVKTDLDKLIYTMKNLEIMQRLKDLPSFLSEDWIDQAIKKLDKSKMTPEQRMHFEMMLAKNASILEMQREETQRLEREVKAKVEKEVKAKVEKEKQNERQDFAKKLKAKGMPNPEIAELTGLPLKEVEKL